MAISQDNIESKWYQALFEEDCVAVMRLLKDHPSLSIIGMESEPLRSVEGRKRREGTGRTRSKWKGRTALHVGASRGCLQLIIQVLGLCNFDGFSELNKTYQDRFRVRKKFSFNEVQVHPLAGCDVCRSVPILGTRWKSTVKKDYDLCPICYEEHGKEEEFIEIEYGLPHGPAGMDNSARTSKVQVHPNIKCNLCDARPILGNRWKSTVKDDFDLCDICYEQHGNEKEYVKVEYGLRQGLAGMETIPTTQKRVEDTVQETPSQSADSALDACNSGDANVEIAAGQPERTDNQVHEVKTPLTSDSSPSSSHDNDISQGYLPTGQSERTQASEKSNSASTGAPARRFKKAVQSTIGRLRRRAEGSKRTEKPSNRCLSDKDVRDLLNAKDGECGLNALGIAALTNNQEVMVFLWYGMQACDGNTWAASEAADRALLKLSEANGDDQRQRLRQVMVQVALDGYVDFNDLKQYYEHRDFNFLPPEEYLFHFSFSNKRVLRNTDEWWEAIRLCGGELWRFVLELQDAQGRPPFHAAMDGSNEETFLELIGELAADSVEDSVGDCNSQTQVPPENEIINCALTSLDRFGRTPAHRAAAKGLSGGLRFILEYAGENGQVAATYHASWRANIFNSSLWPQYFIDHPEFSDSFRVAQDEDFPLKHPLPRSPIHAAIIHGNFECAKLLIGKWSKNWDSMAYRSLWGVKHWSPHEKEKVTILDIFSNTRIMPINWKNRGSNPENVWIWIEWHLVDLACLVGAPESLVRILMDFFKAIPFNTTLIQSTLWAECFYEGAAREDRCLVLGSFEESGEDEKWEGLCPEDIVLKNLWHPLHLAASSGKYDTVNLFINDLKFTPFLDDFEGNSPLHHAMKVRELDFQTHVFDYVDSDHVHICGQCTPQTAKKQILEDNPVAERKGCINLLLEAGCEVFKTNKRKQLPYPRASLNDAKFLSWWYTKKQEEFKAHQNDLNFATNAIAVTATLVATASYVGPLQPPMGYDASQIQYENVWVSIFIVCDTLSFYFAIVAITLALIPSLPMPQQAMLEELQRTRGMVIWAVGVLLPSIFFVFVAFASSSISVMSANITSQAGGILTILSTIIGVVLCFLAFILFTIRLLAFVYPKNPFIRYVYDSSNTRFLSRERAT